MDGSGVLILDSGEVGWAAVRAALDERDDVRLIAEARTRDAALHHAGKHRIDLLLASDQLAVESSYATLAELRVTSCDVSLIGLFVNALEPDELEQFRQLRLAGCCRWGELRTTEAIDAALAAILTGDLLVGTRKVANDYFQIARGTIGRAHHGVNLSDLDCQILTLLAAGYHAEETAWRVGRAHSTINNRLCELRGRLGARTNPQLVYLAHRHCFIDPSDIEALT